MKMGDGGFRPAYNVQLATDTRTRVIVGIDVTNSGSDQGQLPPMLEEIRKRTGQLPAEYLVDGGYTKKESIPPARESRSMRRCRSRGRKAWTLTSPSRGILLR